MSTHSHWHLMKHDDATIFGPVAFDQIKEWAQAAQISPLDKISEDRLNWVKAPMFAELEMDWLLEMSDNHYYGPTTLSAIQEFIKEGEIDNQTFVINCKDASQTKVGELPFRVEKVEEKEVEETADETPSDAVLLGRITALEARLERQQERLDDLEATLNDFLSPR